MAPRTMFRCILRFSLSEASPLFVAERVLLHEDADAQRGEGPDVGSDAVGVRLSAVAAGIDVVAESATFLRIACPILGSPSVVGSASPRLVARITQFEALMRADFGTY